MIFAPHILQVKVITPMDKDEFGRPIPGTGGEYWQEVCKRGIYPFLADEVP